MELMLTISGATCRATLCGRFTFSDNQAFRQVLDVLGAGQITALQLDLSQVDFVDSAALGMLLLARDEAAKASVSLSCYGVQGQVKKMFEVANFYHLFTVHSHDMDAEHVGS